MGEPERLVWSIGATIEVADIDNWFGTTLRKLRDAVATATNGDFTMTPGGLYDRALFLEERGAATLFVTAPPCTQPPGGAVPRSWRRPSTRY
ncbi:hypothetical protein [Mycobacterium sp. 236(2023)]|uniref:hypothetical protein n=1 Tax=Mycobacterium sp. 236(2023) TaxID=3038163 RepID=UPI003242DEF0